MPPASPGSGPPDLQGFRGRWVRSCVFGWLLGFALVLALALLADGLAGGGTDFQFMVGVGMGAGVGVLQGRALRPSLGRSTKWALASTTGLGAPFVLVDLGPMFGFERHVSLAWLAASGALLAGAWQAALLGGESKRAAWWVPASAFGWATALGLTLLPGPPRPGFTQVAIRFLVVVGAGLPLGLMTVSPLAWILRDGRS